MRQFRPDVPPGRQLVLYHLVPGQTDPVRLLRANGDIISGRNPIMRSLNPLGFRFRKVLGQGGGGMAVLVEFQDQTGEMDEWVIKVPNRGTDMGREASNMRLMVGARHMVQRKFIHIPGQAEDADPEGLNGDARDSIYAMELLRHGSVDGLLHKISEQNLKLRDDELWMIFHCLFRACVALAYPGRSSGGLNPRTVQIPLRDEVIPQNVPVETASSLIHFDIDPDNIQQDSDGWIVMIGDFDSDPGSHTHEVAPVFKIGDLGSGFRLDEIEQYRDDTVRMLQSRKMGKVENHVPEQFTKDWDYLDGPPSRTNEPVAGKYSWNSNLYAIGNVMWQLLTHSCTLLPPNPVYLDFDPDGYTTVTGTSYGADLLLSAIADEYDQPLRCLIAWCMMENPANRPTLRHTERMIMENLRIYARDGDPNTAGRTRISDIIANPSLPPPDPVAQLAGQFSQALRWGADNAGPFDAGIVRVGPVPADRSDGSSGARSRARNAVRGARNVLRGNRIRNLARRAGQSVRRVFNGAVRRLTRPNRMTRVGSGNGNVQRGSATVYRRGQPRMADMNAWQVAMASIGMAYPETIGINF
ncbi:hypothetical protein Daus18300_010816 [Diaporthe australafricana]|uniref:Protein kinase domain-containing protein n=1 Tax=Diaporthe australafricana TaxID=127596 RepID=A0ABR3W909_9PEZI